MKLITMEEVAEVLRCDRTSVYRRMAEPGFPPSVRWGKRRLFDADAVAAWVQAQFAASYAPAAERDEQDYQLTDDFVRDISKPGKYADGAGLFLRVVETSGGGVAKSWVFRYRLHGRQRDLGLGKLATWDLAEARERAKKCRQMVHEGQDPVKYYQQFRKSPGDFL